MNYGTLLCELTSKYLRLFQKDEGWLTFSEDLRVFIKARKIQNKFLFIWKAIKCYLLLCMERSCFLFGENDKTTVL